jgi:NAD(P)-dependent dehydrogenase (short-subunit alcohol dehydrogenase family)
MSAYVVTGGTSGIGLAVAHLLLAEPEAHVFCLARSEGNSGRPAEVAGRMHYLECDVTEAAQCAHAASMVRQHTPSIKGLVNAAGIIRAGDIESTSEADWDEVMRVNLGGIFNTSRAFLPLLRAGTGRAVVNVSSVCSLRPCDTLAYSVSKAGVDMLTRGMASTLAKEGIRVNCVNPGVVRTNLQLAAGLVDDYDAFLRQRARMHPLGRVGEPEDVANAVVFLLGRQASWITAAHLSVDGGRAGC